MLIDVTQAHIDHGLRGCGRKCMVALAARPHFPGCEVFVSGHNLYVEEGDGPVRIYSLPLFVFDKIVQFDVNVGSPVQPFSFSLETP